MSPLNPSRRWLLHGAATLAVTVAVALAAPPPSAVAATDPKTAADTYAHQLLAKATPDECFAGVGQPYPPGPPCESGQAKVNQGYVWGLTRVGKRLWFGTGANINCLTSGRNLATNEPNLNDDWVCEYGESQIVKRNPSMPKTLGDHRPPRLYVYDLVSRSLTEKTADVLNASSADADRLRSTAGIRAAGTHQGVALLGGPAIGASINLFAFDTDTGRFLGSVNLPAYGNIRHFVVADNALYAGVGVGANGSSLGHVLRWTGSKSNPFSFVEVADLPAQAADLVVHNGRIFTTTWIGGGGEGALESTGGAADRAGDPGIASVWMSPKLSAGAPGLTADDAGAWSRVWTADQYEPDPVVAGTYALGGLASYGGYLYWGTMHVPLKATYEHLKDYPPVDDAAADATIDNTQRAISIFRGTNFGGSRQRVELLYGSAELPAYDPSANGGVGAWAAAPTGYTPKFGPAGIGNRFNNYTWKMVVTDGKLFVGTMDWSYISRDLQQQAATQDGLSATAAKALADPEALADEGTLADDPPPPVYGGDLFVFPSPNRPATAVDSAGLGNHLNYGVRNIVADGKKLYLGMANPMNLRTDPTDAVPEGGWELIEVTVGRCA